jgi:hypothetical protein
MCIPDDEPARTLYAVDSQREKRLPAQFVDVIALNSDLENEVLFLIEAVGPDIQKASPTQRRFIMRSVFAFIEAMTFSLKNVAISRKGIPLSVADRMIASETAYELKDTGEVNPRPLKLKLLSNVRFAFMLFKKNFGISHDLDVTGEGWEFFRRSIKVRDRLTHPKRASDISVSDLELTEGIEAWKWFQANLAKLASEAVESLNAEATKLRSETRNAKEQLAKLQSEDHTS